MILQQRRELVGRAHPICTMSSRVLTVIRGRTGGRKPKMTPASIGQAQHMRDARQFTMAEVATSCAVTPMRIYRHIRTDNHSQTSSEVTRPAADDGTLLLPATPCRPRAAAADDSPDYDSPTIQMPPRLLPHPCLRCDRGILFPRQQRFAAAAWKAVSRWLHCEYGGGFGRSPCSWSPSLWRCR